MNHTGGHGRKIMVAMSGGVDSSVTAALLQKKGFEVHGVFMSLAQPDLDEQVARVQKIAGYLDVPVQVVDLAEPFERLVLDYFSSSYFKGQTPNPCIVCNPLIKFGLLLDHGLARGMEMMATGHYVRLHKDANGIAQLLKGLDPKKDQSYFLCRLQQQQLQKLLFPLGETAKEEVYQIAAGLGLKGMHSQESQDVCFMQKTDLQEFLGQRLKKEWPQGEIVNQQGKVLGLHNGVFRYTVGQRRGLGVPDATPYYVINLDAERNQVIVGKEKDLWQESLEVREMNWLAGQAPELPGHFQVKIRYRHQAAPAIVETSEQGIKISFQDPQRAITPGQFAVLYDGDQVVGGGEIKG